MSMANPLKYYYAKERVVPGPHLGHSCTAGPGDYIPNRTAAATLIKKCPFPIIFNIMWEAKD